MFDRSLSWFYIWKLWGPRHTAHEPLCIVCQKWAEHDEIFNDKRQEAN